MDVFSLEDEDTSALFITQSDRIINDGNEINEDVNNEEEGEVAMEISLSQVNKPQYSDISDDDFVQIPSSQKVSNNDDSGKRCVKY